MLSEEQAGPFAALARLKRRLRPFSRVPPVRALIGELEEAEARDRRGEPAHYIDMITRLMRLSVLRGTSLEERHADETDQSIHEFERLARDLPALVRSHGGSEALAHEIEHRLADADFPFKRERAIPRFLDVPEPRQRTLEVLPYDLYAVRFEEVSDT